MSFFLNILFFRFLPGLREASKKLCIEIHAEWGKLFVLKIQQEWVLWSLKYIFNVWNVNLS